MHLSGSIFSMSFSVKDCDKIMISQGPSTITLTSILTEQRAHHVFTKHLLGT